MDEDKHQLCTNTVYSGRGVGTSCRIKTGTDQALQSNFPAHLAVRAQGCSRPQLEEGEYSRYEELQQKKEPPMCLPIEGGQTRWPLTAPPNPNHPVIFSRPASSLCQCLGSSTPLEFCSCRVEEHLPLAGASYPFNSSPVFERSLTNASAWLMPFQVCSAAQPSLHSHFSALLPGFLLSLHWQLWVAVPQR